MAGGPPSQDVGAVHMPVLMEAHVDRASGWTALRFGYNAEAKDAVKAIPGAKWNPDKKQWSIPNDALPIIQREKKLWKLDKIRETPAKQLVLAEAFKERLRPYQCEAAEFALRSDGALLSMDPRTGKTPTSIAIACSILEAGEADLIICVYPGLTRERTWKREWMNWAGLDMVMLETFQPLLAHEVDTIRSTPYAVVGCHYEILAEREKCIGQLIEGKRYVLVADELHLAKNRKAARTKTLGNLARGFAVIWKNDVSEEYDAKAFGTCVKRIGLTGTPLRNKPRDLYCVMDFVRPNIVGKGYWNFAKRYCGAHQAEYGWKDDGSSNVEELRDRLGAISFRVTRAQVAPWLPKSERRVILCDVPESKLTSYRKLERALAKQMEAALKSDSDGTVADRETLRKLCEATSIAKMPLAVMRVQDHLDRSTDQQPVKVLVYGHHHQPMKELVTRLKNQFMPTNDEEQTSLLDRTKYAVFEAGGWMGVTDRHAATDQWQQYPGPAVLVVNSLSSGVGIDLSDAEVAIGVEFEWVPADQKQIEDRIVDVHLGKRKVPPLYEYLAVRGTVDERMVSALLGKIRHMEDIVGHDPEMASLAQNLRDAGVVEQQKLGLANSDAATVKAAMEALRMAFLSPEKLPPVEYGGLDVEAMGLEDDGFENEDGLGEASDDDIPF